MVGKSSNIQMIEIIHKALGNLNDSVVFVGGSVMELYLTDSAVSTPRVTNDVDIIAELYTRAKYDLFEEGLRSKGFKNDIDGPACRFIFDNVKVDLISTQDSATGITNKWYQSGFKNKVLIKAGNFKINILPVEFYIASKLEAFKARGASDARASNDLEDIIYILDGNENIKDSFLSADAELLKYLKSEFGVLLKYENIREIKNGHLGFNSFPERIERILEIMDLS